MDEVEKSLLVVPGKAAFSVRGGVRGDGGV